MTAAPEPTTLSAWLIAQAEADEDLARRAGETGDRWESYPLHDEPSRWTMTGVGVVDDEMGHRTETMFRDDAEHIATWDPARALAVARTVRELVARFEQAERLCSANAEEHARATQAHPLDQTQITALRTHGWELRGRRDGLEFALTALVRMYADRDGAERWVEA